MTINLHQLFLLGLLTAAVHWFVARSEIAAPLWSRATGRFGELLRCPACSGFWLGLGLYLVGVRVVSTRYRLVEVAASGFLALLLTPIFEGALLWGLRESALPAPDEDHGDAEADPSLTSTGEVTPLERPPQS